MKTLPCDSLLLLTELLAQRGVKSHSSQNTQTYYTYINIYEREREGNANMKYENEDGRHKGDV